ncbi:MAG TPA: sulfite exporter TauE/SafE family protein [Geminicoccaceae bacterium]
MDIYLPIAEMSVNLFALLGLGGGVGFLSGIFGVGGGFLMTPLLILLGVPPPVAVGTSSAQIVASSVSSVQVQLRRRTVDLKMGLILMAGGFAGSLVGVWVFGLLQSLGQIDLVISLTYVIFLGGVGAMMLVESLRALWWTWRGGRPRVARHHHIWLHRLPLRTRFRRSGLYISALGPLLLGMLAGLLVAMMGVGGGFIMVPAMIYLLGMPTAVVVGTSLFQIAFVAAGTTFMHALNNQTVDMFLALALVVGGVVGAQLGAGIGARLRGEHIRLLLALIVLGVGLRMAIELVMTPSARYSIAPA